MTGPSSGALLSLLFILGVSGTEAQRNGYFPVNNRRVNIDTFNREVNQMMHDLRVPGMSLAVIDDNRIVFYNVYGLKKQDGNEKVNKRTVFEGCSLSKSFLAMVVYQLVDEKKLDLDRPMYQYLEYPPLQHDARYRLITPRMVMSHCSGIENWESENNPDTLDILSDPGKEFNYSGEGYQYLALVVEHILHQPYEKYVTERVLKPLHLNNTYLKYKMHGGILHKTRPWNYAVGHRYFGEQTKLMNDGPIPAAGNHFTAEDYAKLILAIFDGKHLSAARMKDILTPVIRIDGSSDYYGPGFEVVHNNDDIIVAHGGDDHGFKAQMFYSVIKKSGIVFMANSDRGKSMDERLCDMTVQFKIDSFLQSSFYLIAQYPGAATTLLKTYDEQGYAPMLSELGRLREKGALGPNDLDLLSNFFVINYPEIARDVLERNIVLYPDSSLAYALLGELELQTGDADEALKNLEKARGLGFSMWALDPDMKDYRNQHAESERRKAFMTKLSEDGETLIRAENYSAMYRVRLEPCEDQGGGMDVAYIDNRDWIDYRIDSRLGGTYLVTFRVASLPGHGEMELRSGDVNLATVSVPSTKDWQNWTDVSTTVELPAGVQTLKLYMKVGGFNINWIKLKPAPGTSKANAHATK